MQRKKQIPRIGVLMTVYNAGPYLKDAIESILNQSFTKFDFYIVNDGSTDGSAEVISSYKDARIHFLKNDGNKGFVYSLNRGLDLMQNEFIARMDADDIALPERLEKQLEFMDANPNITACGTQVHYFGDSNARPSFPLASKKVKAQLVLANAIVHPTALFRSKPINEHGIRFKEMEESKSLEDYDFWLNVSKIGKLANLPNVLLKYRWHGENMTAESGDSRGDRYMFLYKDILEELGINPSEQNRKLHLELAQRTNKIENLKLVKAHISLIMSQNSSLNIYSQEELKWELNRAWDNLFFKTIHTGFKQVLEFWWIEKRIRFSHLRYLVGRKFKKKTKK